jgi:hypothetical protein
MRLDELKRGQLSKELRAMRTMWKTGATALALVGMVGQAAASGTCPRTDEAMALKTAALQQELMVAALYCNDVQPYNRFVVSYQRELQASDAMLMSFFQHGHGGASAYHAYKTGLANDFSLSGLHGMQAYCSAANAAFDASSGGSQRTLADFIATQRVSGTEAYTCSDSANSESVVGGSSGGTRLMANRRN